MLGKHRPFPPFPPSHDHDVSPVFFFSPLAPQPIFHQHPAAGVDGACAGPPRADPGNTVNPVLTVCEPRMHTYTRCERALHRSTTPRVPLRTLARTTDPDQDRPAQARGREIDRAYCVWEAVEDLGSRKKKKKEKKKKLIFFGFSDFLLIFLRYPTKVLFGDLNATPTRPKLPACPT